MGPRARVHELGLPISAPSLRVLARAPRLGSTTSGPRTRVHKPQQPISSLSLPLSLPPSLSLSLSPSLSVVILPIQWDNMPANCHCTYLCHYARRLPGVRLQYLLATVRPSAGAGLPPIPWSRAPGSPRPSLLEPDHQHAQDPPGARFGYRLAKVRLPAPRWSWGPFRSVSRAPVSKCKYAVQPASPGQRRCPLGGLYKKLLFRQREKERGEI